MKLNKKIILSALLVAVTAPVSFAEEIDIKVGRDTNQFGVNKELSQRAVNKANTDGAKTVLSVQGDSETHFGVAKSTSLRQIAKSKNSQSLNNTARARLSEDAEPTTSVEADNKKTAFGTSRELRTRTGYRGNK